MRDRPRLLVLTSTYPRWRNDSEPGFVHELSRRLAGQYEVLVLCPHAPNAKVREEIDGVSIVRFRYAPQVLESLVNDGGIVNNLKAKPWKWLLLPFFFTAQLIGLIQLVRNWKPDVIHAHWLIPQGLLVALLKVFFKSFPPFLVTSHGADLFALKSPFFEKLKVFVADKASALTVVSSAMRDELQRIGIDSSKVSIQPMGVDLENRFKPEESTNTNSSNHEILFVGRLVEKKGLPYLIKALQLVLKKRADVKLRVIGFGPEELPARRLSKELDVSDQVQFMGPVKQAELPDYYRQASVFAAPFIQANSGDQEGLGLVLIEALGCGCPVVVSDIPASKDVSGKVAAVRTVSMRSESELAEAILDVLDNQEIVAAEVSRSRDQLKTEYDWTAVSRKYATSIDRLLESSR